MLKTIELLHIGNLSEKRLPRAATLPHLKQNPSPKIWRLVDKNRELKQTRTTTATCGTRKICASVFNTFANLPITEGRRWFSKNDALVRERRFHIVLLLSSAVSFIVSLALSPSSSQVLVLKLSICVPITMRVQILTASPGCVFGRFSETSVFFFTLNVDISVEMSVVFRICCAL